MNNFGFKVVDRSAAQLEQLLNYAIAHRRPVEVGLYYDDPAAYDLLLRRLAARPVHVSAHTDHEHCYAFNLHKTGSLLDAHIRRAQSFGSAYSVLHAARLPLPARASARPALVAHLLDNLARAEDICERYDYRLHLENIFHPLDFYRDLFAGILGRGLTRIHVCFDIGHAKVWSNESLDDWLSFLDQLAAAGIRPHFHLHANRGLADEHLSLAEAEALGICGGDGGFNAYGYPGAYRLIDRRFPEAVKVFEVKADQAIANLEAAIDRAVEAEY